MSDLVNKKFTCWHCNRTLPYRDEDNLTRGVTMAIGYVETERGRHCFDCQALFDLAYLKEHGALIMYIVHEPDVPRRRTVPCKAVNFAQTLTFDAKCKSSVHRIVKLKVQRIDAWFNGPDGQRYHGINIGDNDILRVKVSMFQPKKLHSLPDSVFLQPYKPYGAT